MEGDLRSQLEEKQQAMNQETEDLRTQCQQLASQLTSLKQSNSRMLLEHEKMTVSTFLRISCIRMATYSVLCMQFVMFVVVT